jgi:hypothetical protein
LRFDTDSLQKEGGYCQELKFQEELPIRTLESEGSGRKGGEEREVKTKAEKDQPAVLPAKPRQELSGNKP